MQIHFLSNTTAITETLNKWKFSQRKYILSIWSLNQDFCQKRDQPVKVFHRPRRVQMKVFFYLHIVKKDNFDSLIFKQHVYRNQDIRHLKNVFENSLHPNFWHAYHQCIFKIFESTWSKLSHFKIFEKFYYLLFFYNLF